MQGTPHRHEPVPGTRAIALVGPAGAGKTCLAEAMLFASGAIDRQGDTGQGTSIGDSSPEARARGGSTELNLMHFTWLGERFALIDVPGGTGFQADGARALSVADLAIVVVDPDPARAALAAPTLRLLDELGLPHLVFVNRIDSARGSIGDLLQALQPLSVSPLIARQIPITSGDKVSGFVEVALERAFHYRPGGPSEQVAMPAELDAIEAEARTRLLEHLADHDDALLEQLLMDETPPLETVLHDLARETSDNLGVSVLFGSAANGWGVRRLMKALRHEAPAPARTAQRLGVHDPALFTVKVSHGHALGRLVLARMLGGTLREGQELTGGDGRAVKAGALFALQGEKSQRLGEAPEGEVVALAKVDAMHGGEWFGRSMLPPLPELPLPSRNVRLAIAPADRKDDVKLSGALHKLTEEDPTLHVDHDEDDHALILSGVNEEQLSVVLARLKRRHGVTVTQRPPRVGYRESIRRSVVQRGRHKKQSGGHGQFGDVVIELRPQERGGGIAFAEQIHGGAIPRQYIPAVEQGIRDACQSGPMGFPVVDVAVTLTDGSYHSVDSSELAFRTAGRIAMQEALAAAQPHLLEPVHKVTVVTPAGATSKVSSALAARRGQVLGLGPREGWSGWDRVEALVPEAELQGLEGELRSLSQGLATYEAAFDHLAELNGPLAEKIVKAREVEPA
ncbi:elongation factor G [Sphingomonas astaxanthinifaciens]|uniref:Elongation factor G n=1 Tax=Sphingomonas astaxanthinifaciens DSM 22298 TaxID=1123267 RepID=A0ABQ5Z4W0_9SPHN|nr:elongation factor G [Sphingomonas astaxanthinifaciens]GLR47042.1 elongation factor G [Sphingomonas astaxanthinifaciens DSM 22298]